MKFNQSVLEYLRATPSIEKVILSSSLRQYIDQDGYSILKQVDNNLVTESISLDQSVSAIGNTVRAIRAMGKSVVLVAPPPTGRFASNICIERREQGQVLLGPYADCNISVLAYEFNERNVLNALQKMGSLLNLGVIRFNEVLCNQLVCVTEMENKPLYGDPDHLSADGSKILVGHLHFQEKLDKLAS